MMLLLAEVAAKPQPCPLSPAGWFMGTLICAFLGVMFAATIKRLFKRRPLKDGEAKHPLIRLDPPPPKKAKPDKKAATEPSSSNLPD